MYSAKEANNRTYTSAEFNVTLVASQLYIIDHTIKIALTSGQYEVTFTPCSYLNYYEETFIQEYLRSFGYEIEPVEKSFKSDDDEVEDVLYCKISWKYPNAMRDFNFNVGGSSTSNGEWLIKVKELLCAWDKYDNKSKVGC